MTSTTVYIPPPSKPTQFDVGNILTLEIAGRKCVAELPLNMKVYRVLTHPDGRLVAETNQGDYELTLRPTS